MVVPTGPFSDAELRRALLMVAPNDRPVDPAVAKELAERGYFVGEIGSARITLLGRRFLEAPPNQEVRDFLVESLVLRRIVPSGAERRTATGARLVVIAAELWSNETVIRWTIVGEGHQTVGPLSPFRRSVLEDDSGTRYDTIVSGGGGDKYVTHRYDRFAGAVPDAARRLLFTPWDDVALKVTPDSIEPVDSIPILLH